MSQWTHVAGLIRVDALRGIAPKGSPINPDLEAILGPISTYYRPNSASTLPTGSEGSLEYKVIESEHENSLASYTVAIWGDLRDYGSVDAILDWLNKTFAGLMIRSGIVEVDVEFDRQHVLLHNGKGGEDGNSTCQTT